MIINAEPKWKILTFKNGSTLPVAFNPFLKMTDSEEFGNRFERMQLAAKRVEVLRKRQEKLVTSDGDVDMVAFEKYEQEVKQWEGIANNRGFMNDYVKRAISHWQLYKTEEDKENDRRLSVNDEAITLLGDNCLAELVGLINAHYSLTDKEGNASGGSLPADSPTPTSQPAASPISTPITSLPKSTVQAVPSV